MTEDKTDAKNPLNKQELKMAAVEAWQSITKDTQCLVMSMGHRRLAVIEGFATKY